MVKVGETLAGRYRLSETLGGGGLAEVFVAHDAVLRRDVAVKIFDPARVSAEKLERAASVLAAASRVDHPAVALPRIQVGLTHDPPFWAADRIAGEDLAGLTARVGVVPWQRALEIVQACAEGLAALFSATGVAHRALKPGNVRIAATGEVRVLDVAVAELGVQPVAPRGGVFVEYRAPEQLGGSPGNESSDVFALGVLLFELTTGVHPFTGPTAFKVAHKMLTQGAPPKPSEVAPATPLPSQVEALIVRALGRQPASRFKDAAELAAALAATRRSPGTITQTRTTGPVPALSREDLTQRFALPDLPEELTTAVKVPAQRNAQEAAATAAPAKAVEQAPPAAPVAAAAPVVAPVAAPVVAPPVAPASPPRPAVSLAALEAELPAEEGVEHTERVPGSRAAEPRTVILDGPIFVPARGDTVALAEPVRHVPRDSNVVASPGPASARGETSADTLLRPVLMDSKVVARPGPVSARGEDATGTLVLAEPAPNRPAPDRTVVVAVPGRAPARGEATTLLLAEGEPGPDSPEFQSSLRTNVRPPRPAAPESAALALDPRALKSKLLWINIACALVIALVLLILWT